MRFPLLETAALEADAVDDYDQLTKKLPGVKSSFLHFAELSAYLVNSNLQNLATATGELAVLSHLVHKHGIESLDSWNGQGGIKMLVTPVAYDSISHYLRPSIRRTQGVGRTQSLELTLDGCSPDVYQLQFTPSHDVNDSYNSRELTLSGVLLPVESPLTLLSRELEILRTSKAKDLQKKSAVGCILSLMYLLESSMTAKAAHPLLKLSQQDRTELVRVLDKVYGPPLSFIQEYRPSLDFYRNTLAAMKHPSRSISSSRSRTYV